MEAAVGRVRQWLRRNASNLFLTACVPFWLACCYVFTVRQLVKEPSQSCLRLLRSSFALVSLSFSLPFGCIIFNTDYFKDSKRQEAFLYGFMIPILRVTQFFLIVLPFFFLSKRRDFCGDTAQKLFFYYLLLEGHCLILLIKYTESGYWQFLCLLAALVFNSYKGFADEDPHDHVSKLIVCLLSAVMIFLCAMSLHLRTMEEEEEAGAPPLPDDKLEQSQTDKSIV